MFDFLTNTIENTFFIIEDIVTGELPTKKQIAQLISTGITVAAVASATGFTVDIIEKLLEDIE